MTKKAIFTHQTICDLDAMPFFAAFGFDPDHAMHTIDMPIAELRHDKDGLYIEIMTPNTISSLHITQNETVFSEHFFSEGTKLEYRLGNDNSLIVTETYPNSDEDDMDMTPEDMDEMISSMNLVQMIAEAAYDAAKPYIYEGQEKTAKFKKGAIKRSHPHGLN